MRLLLYCDPSTIEISELGDAGAFPWLAGVGNLNVAARAGHLAGIGATEAPNLTVQIDNDRQQATALLGRPLRVAAEVYDDNGDLFFAGLVSTVVYGITYDVTIES
jgi:hypothetical protein